MVLPLLAALPAVFSAIDGVADLFDKGREVYAEVTGDDAPDDPAALRASVEAQPEAVQARFVERMQQEIALYRARTERLVVDQGTLEAELLASLSPEARDRVALMRMVTRPLTVRRMTHVMLLPVYVLVADAGFTLINSAIAGLSDAASPYQIPLLAATFFADGTLYSALYDSAVAPAAVIVVSYMTLREVGKAGGPAKAGRGALDKIAGGVRSVVGLFKGKK